MPRVDGDEITVLVDNDRERINLCGKKPRLYGSLVNHAGAFQFIAIRHTVSALPSGVEIDEIRQKGSDA